jgi:hypothetical protein
MKNTSIKTFTFDELKSALITMIDLRLKSYEVQGMTLTKEQVTELIDDHMESEEYRNIAVFDDRLDRSEMFCEIINPSTMSYYVMMDDDQGYTDSWDFKMILN